MLLYMYNFKYTTHTAINTLCTYAVLHGTFQENDTIIANTLKSWPLVTLEISRPLRRGW